MRHSHRSLSLLLAIATAFAAGWLAGSRWLPSVQAQSTYREYHLDKSWSWGEFKGSMGSFRASIRSDLAAVGDSHVIDPLLLFAVRVQLTLDDQNAVEVGVVGTTQGTDHERRRLAIGSIAQVATHGNSVAITALGKVRLCSACVFSLFAESLQLGTNRLGLLAQTTRLLFLPGFSKNQSEFIEAGCVL